MEKSKELYNGVTPLEQARQDKAQGKVVDMEKATAETVDGLTQAIEATKNWLKEKGSNPDVEDHLKNLEQRLKKAKN